MSKPKIVKPYTNVKIVNQPDKETNVQKIVVGVAIGVLIFVVTSIIIGALDWAGVAIGQSIFSNNEYNMVYEQSSTNSFFINGMGIVLGWISIPFLFILDLFARGVGIIFG